MKGLFKESATWTPALMKKVQGKFIRIAYIDTEETIMGVAFKRASNSIGIVDSKGLEHCVDSPCQVQKISHKTINFYSSI